MREESETNLGPGAMEKIIDSQKAINSLSRQLSQNNARLQSKEYERKVNMYTLRELGQLPENTNLYKASGKMFIQSDNSTLANELTLEISMAKDEIAHLEKVKNGFIQKMKELESQLKETLAKLDIKSQ